MKSLCTVSLSLSPIRGEIASGSLSEFTAHGERQVLLDISRFAGEFRCRKALRNSSAKNPRITDHPLRASVACNLVYLSERPRNLLLRYLFLYQVKDLRARLFDEYTHLSRRVSFFFLFFFLLERFETIPTNVKDIKV